MLLHNIIIVDLTTGTVHRSLTLWTNAAVHIHMMLDANAVEGWLPKQRISIGNKKGDKLFRRLALDAPLCWQSIVAKGSICSAQPTSLVLNSLPALSVECQEQEPTADKFPTHLKLECLDCLLSYIASVINDSLASGIFPSSFKTALFKPLLKTKQKILLTQMTWKITVLSSKSSILVQDHWKNCSLSTKRLPYFNHSSASSSQHIDLTTQAQRACSCSMDIFALQTLSSSSSSSTGVSYLLRALSPITHWGLYQGWMRLLRTDV